jgi:ATP phosphoribosyltransferase
MPDAPDPNAPILRIGIPKGSLQDATIDLLDRAGYNVSVPSRSYIPQIDDPQMQAVLFRAQEMSRYVEDGVIDIGITGHDWIVENDSKVHEVCEMVYSKVSSRPSRWVLAVPGESDIREPEQLAGGIIATELVGTTERYFADRGIDIKKVEFSWGATEVKARLVDAIVDVTETGSSLRANNLRVIDTLVTSTPRLIANHTAWADDWKRQKIEDLALLLQGAINARGQVGLKLNVPRAKLDEIVGMLPAAQSPTVNQLADSDWLAVEIIVDEKVERDLAPKLRRAGATGIFSYPLNKVLP